MRHGHWTGIMVMLLAAALGPPDVEACFCAPNCANVDTAEANDAGP